jgi:triphosphoribosyl-dephospho-CoA synthase
MLTAQKAVRAGHGAERPSQVLARAAPKFVQATQHEAGLAPLGCINIHSSAVARLAVRALYAELALYPKPGLVSFVDNGSHSDMTAETFMRSLFALRGYFRAACRAGASGASFEGLKRLAIAAEARMLRATSGINTHRGAIFSLGMICAAAGHLLARGQAMSAPALQTAMRQQWGAALAAHADGNAPAIAHGRRVALAYGASGAREEGARCFPSVFEIGYPVLCASRPLGDRRARVNVLFALMARLSDTNVLHRAGPQGADAVKASAQAFLDRGGSAAENWFGMALACHRRFVEARISPGGAADLLAASCLVDALTRGSP